MKSVFFVALSAILIACSVPPGQSTSSEQPPGLKELGDEFVYGKGLGTAALNVTGTVLFPPYGIYVLGNSLLELQGYEGYYATDALPQEQRKSWNNVYDEVRSTPGKLAAEASGQTFREK